MKVKITDEHIDRGLQDVLYTHSLAESCAISQAVMEMFPGKQVRTGMSVTVSNGEKQFFRIKTGTRLMQQFDNWVNYKRYGGRKYARPQPRTIELIPIPNPYDKLKESQ